MQVCLFIIIIDRQLILVGRYSQGGVKGLWLLCEYSAETYTFSRKIFGSLTIHLDMYFEPVLFSQI